MYYAVAYVAMIVTPANKFVGRPCGNGPGQYLSILESEHFLQLAGFAVSQGENYRGG